MKGVLFTRRVRRLRRLLAANRAMTRSADPYAQHRLVGELERTPLDLPPHAWNLPGWGLPSPLHAPAHDCTRQVLIQQGLYTRLLAELVTGLMERAYAPALGLPPAWRARLKEKGIRLPVLGGRLHWLRAWFILWLKGAVTAWRLTRHAWRGPPAERLAGDPVLLDFPSAAAPVGEGTGRERNFVVWFRRAGLGLPPGGRVNLVDPGGVAGDTSWGRRVGHPFPRLEGVGTRWGFALAAIWGCTVSLLAGLAGRWWWPVLLRERLDLAYLERVPDAALAREYLFANSGFIRRPLWTYAAAGRGARITLAFYSANGEFFAPGGDGSEPPHGGYQGMTWPRYLVWDRIHADFVRQVTLGNGPAAEILEVGAVDFLDNGAPLPEVTPPSASLFDCSAFQAVVVAEKGMTEPYYTTARTLAFLEDVGEAARRAGYRLLYKRKRPFRRMAGTRYRRYVLEFSERPHVELIDPEISAARLMTGAEVVISMPFSSTALLAQAMGKPSIYYDPVGDLDGYRHLTRGMPLIYGVEALTDWLLQQRGGVS